MKRLHVHVAVDNLDTAIGFYATLFAAAPTVVKSDYAKWMLDDPRVNFAISARGAKTGLNHLGIQVENESELADVYERLQKADRPVLEEGNTTFSETPEAKRLVDDTRDTINPALAEVRDRVLGEYVEAPTWIASEEASDDTVERDDGLGDHEAAQTETAEHAEPALPGRRRPTTSSPEPDFEPTLPGRR
jgi:hypothetical protein